MPSKATPAISPRERPIRVASLAAGSANNAPDNSMRETARPLATRVRPRSVEASGMSGGIFPSCAAAKTPDKKMTGNRILFLKLFAMPAHSGSARQSDRNKIFCLHVRMPPYTERSDAWARSAELASSPSGEASPRGRNLGGLSGPGFPLGKRDPTAERTPGSRSRGIAFGAAEQRGRHAACPICDGSVNADPPGLRHIPQASCLLEGASQGIPCAGK